MRSQHGEKGPLDLFQQFVFFVFCFNDLLVVRLVRWDLNELSNSVSRCAAYSYCNLSEKMSTVSGYLSFCNN